MITQEDNKKTPLLRAEEFNNEDGISKTKTKKGKKIKNRIYLFKKIMLMTTMEKKNRFHFLILIFFKG